MTLNPRLAKLEQHLRDQALALMAETRILADGMDHRESGRTDMAQLDGEPHCWLFHDLYDHSYGFSKPCVPLRDCLRIGKVWVDVVIRQQYCLDIATGEWVSTPDGGERGKEGVKARPRIQRELLRWLSENRQRFVVPARITRRTDRWIEMAFFGANPILSVTLTRWEINIAVEWQGQCWDLVVSHEAGAVASASGYFCTLCVPEARVLYPSREALWRDHLFETFFEWVNDKLLKARWIGI